LKSLGALGGGGHIYVCLDVSLWKDHNKFDGVYVTIIEYGEGEDEVDGLSRDNWRVHHVPIINKFDGSVSASA